MRQLLLLSLAVPILCAAAPAAENARAKATADEPACLEDSFTLARQRPKVEAKRLGELPGGSLVLTVLRKENGCTKPVVVRHGHGLDGGDEPSQRR